MTVQEYIISECKKQRLTDEAIAALMAQIQAESAFIVNNLEDTANAKLGMTDEQYVKAVDSGSYTNFVRDGFGFGIYQLTFYTRKQNFLNYVRARNGSIGDLKLQVGFMFWEFQNYFAGIWNQMKASHDLYTLTKELLEKWENPYEQVENLRVRYGYAQIWINKVKDFKEVNNTMTQNEAIEKVLNIARDEIGYHEKMSNTALDDKTANSGSGNYTKYARDLDALGNYYNGPKQSFAYCDVFVDWCFYKAFGADIGRRMVCQPLQSAGAGCLYSAQYYKQAGRWVTYPQPGDQIFFSYAPGEYSHTGIVESVANGMVNTIEGNTSDMVARRSYPLASSSIVGYGRPNWDLVAESSADDFYDVSIDVQDTAASGYVTVVYRKGSTGTAVREYQEKLQRLGYDLGRWGADGDFGADTYNAVVKFQRDHGLDADGEIGPMTMEAIDQVLDASLHEDGETSNEPVNTTAGVIRPDPVHVIVRPIEDEEPPDDGFEFHEGDIVNFIGNGHYFSPNAKVGFACKPGKAMVRGLNRTANVKHPYRVTAMRGGGSTVNGWVDVDAITAVE